MKNFIIGSGWKMVKTYAESIRDAKELERKLEGFREFPVVIFPSYPALAEINRNLSKESVLKTGGQDLFWEREGAYTGEVSGAMLMEIGCGYVEVNHQERRRFLKEDNDMANRKLKMALQLGLKPFLCVGEEERGTNEEAQTFLRGQLGELLGGITAEQASRIIFAYEPMWAIGKKTTADLEHIQMAHHFIRKAVEEYFGEKTARDSRIVYGGGINMETYLEIAALPDVNGLFTTGCGVCPETYSRLIVTTAEMLKKLS